MRDFISKNIFVLEPVVSVSDRFTEMLGGSTLIHNEILFYIYSPTIDPWVASSLESMQYPSKHKTFV